MEIDRRRRTWLRRYGGCNGHTIMSAIVLNPLRIWSDVWQQPLTDAGMQDLTPFVS
jgi:hypothetical protein